MYKIVLGFSFLFSFSLLNGSEEDRDAGDFEIVHVKDAGPPVMMFDERYINGLENTLRRRDISFFLRSKKGKVGDANSLEELKATFRKYIAKEIKPGITFAGSQIDLVTTEATIIKKIWMTTQDAVYFKRRETKEQEELQEVISVTLQDYESYYDGAARLTNDFVEGTVEAVKDTTALLQDALREDPDKPGEAEGAGKEDDLGVVASTLQGASLVLGTAYEMLVDTLGDDYY